MMKIGGLCGRLPSQGETSECCTLQFSTLNLPNLGSFAEIVLLIKCGARSFAA